MPPKAYEPDDPSELVGVALPAPQDAETLRAMATVFIEEFALLGWPRETIRRLFASPRFAGPHRVYRALGADAVREIVESVFPEADDRGTSDRSLAGETDVPAGLGGAQAPSEHERPSPREAEAQANSRDASPTSEHR